MRRSVIGLDIGTTAVRAVEISLGRRAVVRRMGQVALPPGAVVAGEVVEPEVVAAALKRLWRAVKFSSREVAVGVANARVVARATDLPNLSDDELRSSLPFHVADLLPMPVDEVELDFLPINGTARGPRGLIVAAHREVLAGVLAALDGAGLKVARIDLVPLALVRAVHDTGTWLQDDSMNEVIIGAGAGVTNVVVHRHGVVDYVRTLPGGGGLVTNAIAAELRLDDDDAEAVKRGLVDGYDIAATARRALTGLAYEIASSIEFHLNQLDDPEVRRVVLAGGGGRLVALRNLLEEQLGVPVVDAEPYARVRVAKLRIDRKAIADNGDLFAVAIGLALGSGVNLLPRRITAARTARRDVALAGVGASVVLAGLAGLTYVRMGQTSDAEAIAAEREQATAALEARVASFADVAASETKFNERSQAIRTVLTGDVPWWRVLQDVASAVPENAWITSLNGSRQGVATVQVTAKGFDQTATANWLERAGSVGSLRDVWLTTSTAVDDGLRPLVQFSSNATVTAQSDRTASYLEGDES
jgi:type IV pilus assembly protein PilM